MRRTVGEFLINALALLSLLLCLGSTALLARSYWVTDWISRVSVGAPQVGVRSGREWRWLSGAGGAALSLTRYPWASSHDDLLPPDGIYTNWRWEQEEPAAPVHHFFWDASFWNRRGFGYAVYSRPYDSARRIVMAFPLWLPALLFSLPPALWLRRRIRRRRRARAGHCPGCGYDLRATPGRCPECGHTPAGAAT